MSKKKVSHAPEAGIQFLMFRNMMLPVRILLAICLIAGGFAFQDLLDMLWVGLLLMLTGSLMLALRTMKSKPDRVSKKKVEWEEVTVEEWDRVKLKRKEVNRWKRHIFNLNSWPGAMLFVVLCIAIFVILFAALKTENYGNSILALNIMVLFIPTLLFGSISGWNPPELPIKLTALRSIYDHYSNLPEGLEIKTMLGLSPAKTGKETGTVPTDARLVINFTDAPDGFYGVQVQASINNVSGTGYPYLYAVVLTRPDYWKAGKKAPSLDADPKKMQLEYSRSEEAAIFVIRQKTTKTSGYTTSRKQAKFVVETALEYARGLLK